MLVFIVGVTGFEPATTRPPDVYATGLRHTPIQGGKFSTFLNFFQSRFKNPRFLSIGDSFPRILKKVKAKNRIFQFGNPNFSPS